MAEPNTSRSPAFASDTWMLEQQLRAEVEAAGWRRLREELSRPPTPIYVPPAAVAALPPRVREREPFEFGAAMLKGIVRFGIGAFGAYLAYIAALDSGLGEFEAWLAVIAGFVVALSLTAFGPGRRVVRLLAETTRWALIIALGVGAVWLFSQMAA